MSCRNWGFLKISNKSSSRRVSRVIGKFKTAGRGEVKGTEPEFDGAVDGRDTDVLLRSFEAG